MKVEMTVLQRLNLEGLIRNQRCKKVADAELFFGARKKFVISDAERTSYIKEFPGGQVGVNLEAARIGPTITVDFEAAEIRSLIERLDGYAAEPGLLADDVEWFSPLKASLVEAKNAVDKA